ncbi:MAG: hypothetical protein VW082_01570 [Candidatus Nanopelagicales bacterium]
MPHVSSYDTAAYLGRVSGGRPFSRAMASSWQVSDDRMSTLISAGLVHRVRGGWYVVPAPAEPAVASSAETDLIDLLRVEVDDLARRGHASLVAGRTATDLWGVGYLGERGPLPASTPTLLCRPSPSLRPGRRGKVLIRFGDWQPEQVTELHGLPITTPLTSAIDVAREVARSARFALPPLVGGARLHIAHSLGLDPASAMDITNVAQDPAVRSMVHAALRRAVSFTTVRGVRPVRAALPLVDPRLETVLESFSWASWSQSGLVMPVPQQWITTGSGTAYRVDFALDNVIGEADGKVKYQTPEALWAEKTRQIELEGDGFDVVRWTFPEMLSHPADVFRRIRWALENPRKPTKFRPNRSA